MSEDSTDDAGQTVEVCQRCEKEYDDLLDVVLNADHSGPFRQETRSVDTEQ